MGQPLSRRLRPSEQAVVFWRSRWARIWSRGHARGIIATLIALAVITTFVQPLITSQSEASSGPNTAALNAQSPPGTIVAALVFSPQGGGWETSEGGSVTSFGGAISYGSLTRQPNMPIVGMAATPDGRGYWLVASDGGIFTAGDAGFYGSGASKGIGDRIIGMAPSADGLGYFLISQDGMSYPFGDTSPTNTRSTSSGSSGSPATGSSGSSTPTAASTPTSTTAPSPTTNPSSGFVTRSGTKLTLNGQPYLFTGINIYMAASGGTPSSCGGELYPNVGVPLSEMPDGIVFRFWAFQNFFESNGSFNWTYLDQVLAIAAAHGDKVIPVLANQYSYCDGITKDLAWYQSGYETTVDPGNIVTYRQYVSDVVSRYANNPTIAMWQLVNEGEAVNSNGSCSESAASSALLKFSNDVGTMVHSLDPNHLVSLGTIAGYSGSGGQWCGAADSDYQTLMASPGSDVCDYHDYGSPADPMGRPSAPDLATAIQMCHVDGKPIMVAETGIYADSSAGLTQRATEFSAKLSAQFQAGVVGELMWCWTVAPGYVLPDADPDYGIFPGDPSLGVLGTS